MAEMRAAVLQKDRSLIVQSITRPQILPGSSIDNGKVQHHPEDLHATLLGMLKFLLPFDWACRTITSSFAPCRTMRLTKAESLREGWNAPRKCRLTYTVLLSSSLGNVYTGECLYSTANHAQPIMIPPKNRFQGYLAKERRPHLWNLGNIQPILYKPSSLTY